MAPVSPRGSQPLGDADFLSAYSILTTTADLVRMVVVMDRGHAVTILPTLHAVAIRLHDEGADAHTIAVATGVDDDQVAGMLEVAEAKLVRLMEDGHQ